MGGGRGSSAGQLAGTRELSAKAGVSLLGPGTRELYVKLINFMKAASLIKSHISGKSFA